MEDLAKIGTMQNNMPELPEVETIKNVLKPILIGNTITSIDVLRSQIIQGNPMDFKQYFEGETFENIERKGKYLIFHFKSGKVLVSHLRMEGKYFEYNEDEPNSYFSRVVFHLNNRKKICYDDSRGFGTMTLANKDNYLLTSELSKLGPEPFDIKNIDELYIKAKTSSLNAKAFITNQNIISGIGNIYADEILFACKIHPETSINSLTINDISNIIEEAKIILSKAIESGGSTIRSYHPGKDISGNFQVNLKVYGKAGEQCPICGHELQFKKVGGRGTTYCPICQIKKSKKLVLGIYGKTGSGKSTLSNKLKEKGIPVFSSDCIVHELYLRSSVANALSKALNNDFGESVDREKLRLLLANNPQYIKKVNSLIHPLVENEIISIIKKIKKGIIAFEVPLLYESKFEYIFDYVIALDVNEQIQKDRVINRNGKSAEQLLKINKNHRFDEFKKKADVIIENNTSIESFYKQIDTIIYKLEDRLL